MLFSSGVAADQPGIQDDDRIVGGYPAAQGQFPFQARFNPMPRRGSSVASVEHPSKGPGYNSTDMGLNPGPGGRKNPVENSIANVQN